MSVSVVKMCQTEKGVLFFPTDVHYSNRHEIQGSLCLPLLLGWAGLGLRWVVWLLGRRGPMNVCSEVRNNQDVMFCSSRQRTGSDRHVPFFDF